jgi:glycerol-3-phosphate O-acyltransferase
MKITSLKNKFLHGTHFHFRCYLPKSIGFFPTLFLKQFFAGLKFDHAQAAILKGIPTDARVVFVTKPKSYFEYLFSYSRYKQIGGPIPEIGFDYQSLLLQPVSQVFRMLIAHIDYFFRHFSLLCPYQSGYIKDGLLNGHAGFLSLVEKRGFYRRFVKAQVDPITHLIDIQQSIDPPIYLVPQLMFFSKTPMKSQPALRDMLFGPEQAPGKIRRLITLFKNPGKIFVELSQPINLKAYLNQSNLERRDVNYQSLILRRDLLLQINRHRQSILGPVLKTREELKENILTRERFQQFLATYSENHDIPLQKLRKKSDAYLEEIAAKYNMSLLKIFDIVLTWILKNIFEGLVVDQEGLDKVKRMSQRGPLLLMPCHKSHIDYLVLSYIMYHNNMPCPHIAAGKNLSFWPLGPIFRNAGAFFIRRTFKGAVLYSKVFSEYIYKLLEEGFNIEFFIEGGRSRTGKLLTPKFGLLTILLNAYKKGACNDLIFVPLYIGYDRVIEEDAYLYELEGGKKEKENISQVIKARRFLKKRYGKVYVKFNEPISIHDMLLSKNKPIQEMPQPDLKETYSNIGYRMIGAINQVSIVTPYSLVSSTILNSTRNKLSMPYVQSRVEVLVWYLLKFDIILSDTLVIDSAHSVEMVIDQYFQRKFIEPIVAEHQSPYQEAEFTLNVSKRPVLDYYKNGCINFFVPLAYTALSILAKDAFQFSSTDLYNSYSFLKKLFINEFAYDVDKPSGFFIRKSIKAFIDDAVLIPHPTLPDTYNLTSAGLRRIRFFTRFLTTFFESYWVVLSFFSQTPASEVKPKDRLKKIESLGNTLYKQKEIERKEALSGINYKNALNHFESMGIQGKENTEVIDHYAHEIHNYLKYLKP